MILQDILLLTLPMVLAWIRYYPKLIVRVLGVTVFTAGLWLLILTTSRSCYLAVLTGLVFWFLFLLRWNKKIKALALTALVCVLFVVAFPTQTQDILKRLNKVRQDAGKLMNDFRKLGNHLRNASSAYDSSEKRLDMFSDKVEKLLETKETKN